MFVALLAATTAALTAAAENPILICATCVPPGLPVDVGASVRRDVDPVVFRIFVDPEVARVSVSVAVGDATINGVILDYRTRTAPFSLAAGPCRIEGTLMLRLNEAPGVSALYLDGVVQSLADGSACARRESGPPALARAFRGDLVQWRSPSRTVLLRDRHFLTANLSVQIDVLPDEAVGQMATLTFFIGGQLLLSVPVRLAGSVSLNQDVRMGETIIRAGARFSLTPPSPVTNGSLVAQDLRITTGTSSIDASGVLFSWPAPSPGPPSTDVPVASGLPVLR
ncbi:hypothetical protein J2X19_001762 [Rhodoferax ferrireducens]|uniref:Secreted protein n=1 Tax=Rhodoferax ferrireducens TaxID=192843 RepID=A0ABU2C757_9BURK|nr:hypothetical protein [Rhodoferax ferrireducens]MDR7377104.1 hypothetical protein [Rhodoferax ferrireducens]